MASPFKKIDNFYKKFKKKGWKSFRTYYLARMKYPKYYRNLPIDEKMILLESQHGRELNGNIFYVLKELAENPQYKQFNLYFTVIASKFNQFRSRLDEMGLNHVKLVILSTQEYFKVLATAKYLFNDTSFIPAFIKRREQVYTNTWHGTPFKTMGKKIKEEPHALGNIQKNFFVSDYLLQPNEYTMEHMIEDYMLENLSHANLLLGGYPRNTAFFDSSENGKIKEELEIGDKSIYMYMPTWRGTVTGGIDAKANIYLQYYLFELDKQLTDKEILYVNLHPMARKNVNFNWFEHIRQFPENYETYEFLNIADVLITDYSSVFYDFAVTQKKIVLFTYDEEEYFHDRGMYEPLESLPFPKVKTLEKLLYEMRSPKEYDDSEFLKKYAPYDSINAAKELCQRILFGTEGLMREIELKGNGKKNVLIYVGNLPKNGITTAVMNLLKHVDTSQHNYYITFVAGKVKPNREILFQLPANISYIPTTGAMNMTFWQKVSYLLYTHFKFPFSWFWRINQHTFKEEIKRCYGDIKFSDVVHFTGYEFKKILFYSLFDSNRIIYVHNDMLGEVNIKRNQRREILEYAYTNYDKVAVVAEGVVAPTKKFLKKDREINVVHNLMAQQEVVEKSKYNITFDDNTQSNIELEELIKILHEPDTKVYINVGRYAPEKGQKQLINAFARIWKENPKTYLFIIGGYQLNGLRDELLDYIQDLECKNHIALILSMSNPFPIFKACDYFVLSSFYEAFPFVLMEANILGLPFIFTDIEGPKEFMQKHGARIVENSEEGLYQGMQELLEGKVPVIDIDYEEYNKKALEEFYDLLEK